MFAILLLFISFSFTWVCAKHNVNIVNSDDYFVFDSGFDVCDGIYMYFYIPYPIFDFDNKRIYAFVYDPHTIDYIYKGNLPYRGLVELNSLYHIYEWSELENVMFDNIENVYGVYISESYMFVLFRNGSSYGLVPCNNVKCYKWNIFNLDQIIRDNGGVDNIYRVIPSEENTLIVIFKSGEIYVRGVAYKSGLGIYTNSDDLLYASKLTELIRSKGGVNNILLMLFDNRALMIIFKDGTVYGIGPKEYFGYEDGVFDKLTRLVNIENEIKRYCGIDNLKYVIMTPIHNLDLVGFLFITKDNRAFESTVNGINKAYGVENILKQGYKPMESSPYLFENGETYRIVYTNSIDLNYGHFLPRGYEHQTNGKIVKLVLYDEYHYYEIGNDGKLSHINFRFGTGYKLIWNYNLPTSNFYSVKSSYVWSYNDKMRVEIVTLI